MYLRLFLILFLGVFSTLSNASDYFIKLSSQGIQNRQKMLQQTGMAKSTPSGSGPGFEYNRPLNIQKFDYQFSEWLKISIDRSNQDVVLDSLIREGIIDYYEPIHSFHIDSNPNDSLFTKQWYLNAIKAVQAWDITSGSDSVIVGVIDTGIDYTHPDLQGSLWINEPEKNGLEGIDDDGNGYIDDYMGWDFTDAPRYADGGDYRDPDNDPMDEYGAGHGTQVAGIIAAQSNNSIGISGIAPEVKIMNLRAGTAGGYLEEDDVANAILYALDNGAQIVNMSFGDVALSRFLKDIIYFAYQQGLVMVASAGNSGNEEIHYPSGLSETISVGASTIEDNVTGFSNFGPTIDLVAPGQDILSTAVGGGYSEVSGTSFSAPMVSATAALIKSIHPEFTIEEIRNILKTSSEDILFSGWDKYSGAGRASAFKAVQIKDGGELRMISPIPGSSSAKNEITVIGTAIHPDLKSVEADYGIGSDPSKWYNISTFQRRQVLNDTIGYIDVSEIEENSIIIRLRMVLNSGLVDESRNILNIDRTGPKISNVQIIDMLNGSVPGKLITLETDDICTVSIFFKQAGQETFNIVKEPGYETTTHRLLIDENEFEGDYQIKIVARNLSGLITQDDNNGDFYNFNIHNNFDWIEFQRTDWTVPEGYMLDSSTDLDHDGKKEIVLSHYDENHAFGPVEIYEFDNGNFEKRSSTNFTAIPRAAGDVDSDGRSDVLLGFGQLSYLFESANTSSFPSQLIWMDTTNFWAAGYSDLDHDNNYEIVGRIDSVYHLFEADGNNYFTDKIQLLNTTSGLNQYGIPKIINLDLNGDSNNELLFGDYDGDLLAFTGTSDNTSELLASGRTQHEDATSVFSGINTETGYELFAATHTSEDLNSEHEFDARYWTIERFRYRPVYHDFETIQSINIFGYQSLKDFDSGIKLAIMDDQIYLYCSFYPQLYVFRVESDNIVPIWYSDEARSNTILVDDYDNDGYDEFYYNNGKDIIGFSRGVQSRPARPADFSATPLDSDRVSIKWDTGREGQFFKLYKGESKEELQAVLQTNQSAVIDSSLQTNQTYFYAVSVIDSQFEITESFLSAIDSAVPSIPPKLIAAEFVNDRQVKFIFDEKIQFNADQTFQAFSRDLNSFASSALLLRDQKSVLAGFAVPFIADKPDTLEIKNVYNVNRVPIDERYKGIYVTYSSESEEPYLTTYKILNRKSVQLFFSEPMQVAGLNNPDNYELFPKGSITNTELLGNESSTVQLTLSDDSMIGALGTENYLRLNNLYSQKGIRLKKTNKVYLQEEINNLDHVLVYPMPVKPENSAVTFAKLPENTQIHIFTLNGKLVRKLDEPVQFGGVNWDLKDNKSNKVSSGIYIYQIIHDDREKFGKLVIVR